MHRADAELALGREPEIDPDVAADGIGELLTNPPSGRRTAEGLAAGLRAWREKTAL